MEELVEGVCRAIFKMLKVLVFDFFFELFCYWIGRVFLLMVTFGHYPRGKKNQEHEGRIAFIGLIVIIFSVVLLIKNYK